MRNALVVDANDVKAILAAHFGVPEANVIKSQYSYTVIQDVEKEGGGENETGGVCRSD